MEADVPVPPPSAGRFEIKYLIDGSRLAALRADVAAQLRPDPEAVGFGPLRQYQVWSCYYDTSGLRHYWEKLDGNGVRCKLRIRSYGPPEDLRPDTPVWVELKHRDDRVTHKRRVRLPYREAVQLCAAREPEVVPEADRAVVDEVLAFVIGRRVRPTAVVGYNREAWVGDGVDRRLRITFDRHVRGRDRDLHLQHPGGRLVLDPQLCIVEVKTDDRVPRWLVETAARHALETTRLSKYCECIDAFGGELRSSRAHDAELEALVAA